MSELKDRVVRTKDIAVLLEEDFVSDIAAAMRVCEARIKELQEREEKLVAALEYMPQACEYAQELAELEGRTMNAVFWGMKAEKIKEMLK